jgi:YHS domain-containing protein
MNRTRRALLATALLVSISLDPAIAGEFFERDGAAIGGYDPVAYVTEMKPVKGSEQHRVEFQGSTFLFASAANREAFLAQPEKFTPPQYGGFCAYGMAKGYKAAIDPAAFTVVGDKLYLNYNGTVRALWILDIRGYVKKADRNWPDVRKISHVIP